MAIRVNGEMVQLAEPNAEDIFEVEGATTAEYRLTELDQVDPAGRYRLLATGDTLLVERAVTAAWATALTIITISNALVRLDVPLSLPTSITLRQAAGNYTFTWDNPAATRSITMADPGGPDVFAWRDATQTLGNKTLTAPTLNGTITLGSSPILTSVNDLIIRTTGNLQDISLTPTRAVVLSLGALRVAVANEVSLFVVDIAAGDARLGIQAEAGGITHFGNNAIRQATGDLTLSTIAASTDISLLPIRDIVLRGGAIFHSSSATPFALNITNAALVAGSVGSIIAPVSTDVVPTDALFGDVNGAIGLRPTTTRFSARLGAAWVGVALAGYAIQGVVPAAPGALYHPLQVLEWDDEGQPLKVDEARCFVCGEKMRVRQQIMFYGNRVEDEHDLHAIFGHPHLELDPVVVSLESRINALERSEREVTYAL